MKAIAFVILLAGLVVSCKDFSHNKDSMLPFLIDYTFNPNEAIVFSSFFDTVIFTPLRGVGEFSGNVNQVKVLDSVYYVTDGNSSSGVYIFDSRGNYISKIGSRGRGPGEFISLTDYLISDLQQTIHIYDNSSRKIYIYDIASGEFLRSVEMNILGVDIELLSSGNYLLYTKDVNRIGNKDIQPGVLLISADGSFLRSICELDPAIESQIGSMNYFSRASDKELWFCDNTNGTINKVSEFGIEQIIEIKGLSEGRKNSNNNTSEISTEQSIGFISFLMTDSLLICVLSTKENGPHGFIYEFKKGKVFSGGAWIDDISGLPNYSVLKSTDGNLGPYFQGPISLTENEYSEAIKMAEAFNVFIELNPSYRQYMGLNAEGYSTILKTFRKLE